MSADKIKSRIWTGKPSTGGDGTGGDGSSAFNGERPISRQTPGLIGFDPNTTTILDFLEEVFYPALPPEAELSVNDPIREIGQDPGYILSWDVVAQTNPITGITVDGIAINGVTGASQAGTQKGFVANSYGSYTKNMSCTDGTLEGDANCTITYLPRMFWGTIADKSDTSDADILALQNSELTASRALTLSNFGGGGTYLCFAMPSSFGTPSFTINGLANTAFTKMRSGSNFVNSEGATIVMDVWVSNNLYNSPLSSVIIS